MNLTDYDSALPLYAMVDHMSVASAYRIVKESGAMLNKDNPYLAGFFSRVVDSVKRTLQYPGTVVKGLVTQGPKGALQAIKNERGEMLVDFSQILRPVGAVVTPFAPVIGGAITAVGTGAKYLVDKQNQAKQVQGQGAALVQKYQSMAGQIPGRLYDLATLQSVLANWLPFGAWDPIRADTPNTPAIQTFTDNVGKAAQAGLQRGATSAIDVFNNEWQQIISQDPRQAWMLHSNEGDQRRELTIDFIDNAMAQMNPNLPYSYGVDQSQLDQPTPTPAQPVTPGVPGGPLTAQPILTTTISPPTPQGIASPVPTMTPAPQSQALTQAGVNPQTSDQVNALLAQMQQQGANQAQMMQAALSALAARGVNTQAPAVQQAAAADVAQMQTAGISSVPSWLLPVLAGGAILFALGFPSRGRSNRAAFSSRKTNPRRRRKRR